MQDIEEIPRSSVLACTSPSSQKSLSIKRPLSKSFSISFVINFFLKNRYHGSSVLNSQIRSVVFSKSLSFDSKKNFDSAVFLKGFVLCVICLISVSKISCVVVSPSPIISLFQVIL
jgi:hypothetical protein